MDDARRERWERLTSVPLTLAAVLFLAAYAWPILEPTIRQDGRGTLCGVVTTVVWVLFAVDYVVRLALSRDRRQFVLHNVLDLLVVVVPVLRPLRLLRLITVLRALNRGAEMSFGNRVAVYASGWAVVLVLVSSLAMLDAERDARGANITDFGNSLWWAMTTITTVGYGDVYPVTATGRWIATGLMLAGVALLAVITGSFASWLLTRFHLAEQAAQTGTAQAMDRVLAEIQELREEVAGPRTGR